MKLFPKPPSGLAGRSLMAAFLIAAAAAFPARAFADRYPLVPQTKLRVTIVQWIPSKGEYQRWDSVSGDFVVSNDGTVRLPLVGALNVADLDTAGFASQIAERFKTKAGLIEAPDATVEVL